MVIDTSIIITNFNREKYLGRAIRSCLKQSLDKNRYEIIVIDDASADNSKKIIESFGDKIIPIYLKRNVGVAGASNVGIKKALGNFIIRVDSDDYINEHALLILTELMIQNCDLGFVYTDHILVDEKENHIERFNLNTLYELYKHGAGIIFRKSYLESIGLYDSEMRHAEDYDLLKRYIKNFDGYHLRLPLYRYRQWTGNQTKLGKREEYIKKSDTKTIK